METLKQYVETQKTLLNDRTININDLVIIRKNKNGTVNCSTKINNKNIVINYINPKLIHDDTIVVRFGKKDPEWKQDYWYQVDDNDDEEVA